MKVLSKGGSMEITCPLCNSDLEIELKDVHIDNSGRLKTPHYCNCGACGKLISLIFKSFPSYWKTKMMEY
jgi:C4-type Zn-finger protein